MHFVDQPFLKYKVTIMIRSAGARKRENWRKKTGKTWPKNRLNCQRQIIIMIMVKSKVKVKLYLCVIEPHTMKTYGEVEV
jgi:hypothetical protein